MLYLYTTAEGLYRGEILGELQVQSYSQTSPVDAWHFILKWLN